MPRSGCDCAEVLNLSGSDGVGHAARLPVLCPQVMSRHPYSPSPLSITLGFQMTLAAESALQVRLNEWRRQGSMTRWLNERSCVALPESTPRRHTTYLKMRVGEIRMAKVVLSDREVGLIKGLIQHRALNDQQVLAIFSFLDRNFNHREIGAIRKGAKLRYAKIGAAPVPEVDALLYHYNKLAALAQQLGFYPTTYREAQVRKAVEIFRLPSSSTTTIPYPPGPRLSSCSRLFHGHISCMQG